MGQYHLGVLALLREHIAKHGWARLTSKRLVAGGVDLVGWIERRRTAYRHDRIAEWLADECDRIPGWTWDPVREKKRRTIDRIRSLVRQYGWERFPTKAGFLLSRWIVHRREEYRRRVLERWIVDALEAIPGWSWDPRADHYARNLRELRGHVVRNGWESVHRRTLSRSGISIGTWVEHIRVLYRRGAVSDWLVAGLESIPGWIWDPRAARQRTRVDQLRRYVAAHGWTELSQTLMVRGVPLGQWVANCRARYRDGTLSPDTRRALEQIPGWSWGGRQQWSWQRDSAGRFGTNR